MTDKPTMLRNILERMHSAPVVVRKPLACDLGMALKTLDECEARIAELEAKNRVLLQGGELVVQLTIEKGALQDRMRELEADSAKVFAHNLELRSRQTELEAKLDTCMKKLDELEVVFTELVPHVSYEVAKPIVERAKRVLAGQ